MHGPPAGPVVPSWQTHCRRLVLAVVVVVDPAGQRVQSRRWTSSLYKPMPQAALKPGKSLFFFDANIFEWNWKKNIEKNKWIKYVTYRCNLGLGHSNFRQHYIVFGHYRTYCSPWSRWSLPCFRGSDLKLLLCHGLDFRVENILQLWFRTDQEKNSTRTFWYTIRS